MKAAVPCWLCVALILSAGVAALAQDGLQGYKCVSRASVPLDGSAVATAPLEAGREAGYRVVVAGTFHFAHNDLTYDAVYAPDGSRHRYVRIDPPDLPMVQEDRRGHRFVFSIPQGMGPSGRSITAGIDTSRFVDDFIIPPSEVKQALSGGLSLELWERPATLAGRAPRLSPAALVTLLCLVLIVGGVSVGALARAARERDELRARLARIDAKHRAASREAAKRGEFFAELRVQLGELHATAHRLANVAAEAGRAQRGVSREALEHEIGTLEARLAAAGDPAIERETERTLTQKRAALEALATVHRRRESALMRLAKIEGALDTALLRIPDMALRLASGESEDGTISAVHTELDLIRRVTEEVALDADPTRPLPPDAPGAMGP